MPYAVLEHLTSSRRGMTCWRRLRDWKHAGVWQQLHQLLLARLRAAEQLNWSRAVGDSSHVRALNRGNKTGASPVDRGRAGSKHHLLTDGGGIPLAVRLTGANRNDVTQLLSLVEAIPTVRGKRGRPRRRPAALLGDRGDDADPHRQALRYLGVRPQIARRKTAHGLGLGRRRYVVERSIAWLPGHRRLRIRWEHRADIHEASSPSPAA